MDQGIYPTKDNARDALDAETLFVGTEDETIVGSAIINKIQPDIYRKASWITSASDDEVMVLHTLSISPAFQAKAMAKTLFISMKIMLWRMDVIYNRAYHCRVQLYSSASFRIHPRERYRKGSLYEPPVPFCKI